MAGKSTNISVGDLVGAGLGAVTWIQTSHEPIEFESIVLCGLAAAMYLWCRLEERGGGEQRGLTLVNLAGLVTWGVGYAGGLILFQAVGVALMVCRSNLEHKRRPLPYADRYWPLILLSFPLELDVPELTNTLRICSAIAAEVVLNTFGYGVVREGTELEVSGQLVAVARSCGGVITLQALLTMGMVTAVCVTHPNQRLWTWLPVLCVLAWLTNVGRVVMMCAAATQFERATVETLFHDWGGLGVNALGMAVSYWLLTLISSRSSRERMLISDQIAFRASETRATQFRCVGGKASDSASSGQCGRQASRIDWLEFVNTALVAVCVVVLVRGGGEATAIGSDVIRAMPKKTENLVGVDIPLSDEECDQIGSASCVKRRYAIDGEVFDVTLIDASGNHRAVHDPSYCWKVVSSKVVQLPRGRSLRSVTRLEHGEHRDAIFGFGHGEQVHCSYLRYRIENAFWQLGFRENLGSPRMVIIDAATPVRVNWYRVIDQFPELFGTYQR